MPSAAFVRLGPTSASKSKMLADAPQGRHDLPVTLQCAQVPNDFDVGSQVWIWLGSDNNKGQPTEWTQGIRALGVCERKSEIGQNKFEIEIGDLYILSRTIEKQELLQVSPETYATSLYQAAIVGLNNYSSQVVQLINPEESATIAALIARLLPTDAAPLQTRVPLLGGVTVAPRLAIASGEQETFVPEKTEMSVLPNDDPVYERVRSLLFVDKVGGVLLVGPPGTGKTWYARQIALKLVDGHLSKIREVQFHPAYQYEDFVEGYVPDSARGFVLKDKHLLVMAGLAKSEDKAVVLIIDEFSRTDPSRVLGETMTYMETSYRDKEFRLPSGRRASIPHNLVFLATMNPEDRSVEEIDTAMERRWAKVALNPDPAMLRIFLGQNAADPRIIPPIIELFVRIQEFAPIGHGFFRSVRDEDSLRRLWDTQIHPIFARKFKYDVGTLEEIGRLWARCLLGIANALAPEPVATDATGQVG